MRQLTPDISVAPNGRVDVVWFDTRTNLPSPIIPRPAGQGDVYYASSTDGGATFSGNRRISDRSINLDDGTLGRNGTYTWWGPDSVPLGNDSVLFAWGDARYGNVDTAANDVVLATMRLGEPGPAVITELPKASPANLSVAVAQMAYPGGAERIGADVHLQAGRRPQGRRGRRLGRRGAGPVQPLAPAGGRREVADQGAEGGGRAARLHRPVRDRRRVVDPPEAGRRDQPRPA